METILGPVNLALARLQEQCEDANYRGWDLYDGLNSKVFQATPFRYSKMARLVWIQLFKRSPINLRPLFRVPRDFNTKGLALFASGYSAQGDLSKAERLLETLVGLSCEGFTGQSWGYNFDWQARAFYVPKGTPNLVSTVFVANAFMDFYVLTRDEKYLAKADEACMFLLRDMILYEDSRSLCFRYIPGEDAVVHNAYMLGAALLGRVYRYTKKMRYLEASEKAMNRAIMAQGPDGSWRYGERQHHQFIDNFHTGYNLVALNDWMENTGNNKWDRELRRAYSYWLDTFFTSEGCPRYYSDNLYPIDVHCSAQGIVTCVKLQHLDTASVDFAQRIAAWAIANMQSPSGWFYYKKERLYTNKTIYLRWTQAWMFYALSLLQNRLGHSGCPSPRSGN